MKLRGQTGPAGEGAALPEVEADGAAPPERNGRLPSRLWRRTSLRVRLLIGLLALSAVGLLITAAVGNNLLRSYLVKQTDQRLVQATSVPLRLGEPAPEPFGARATLRVSPVRLSIVVTTAEAIPSPSFTRTVQRTFVRSFLRSSESRPRSANTVESWTFSSGPTVSSRSAIGEVRFPAS